jgi:hypothetical protein
MLANRIINKGFYSKGYAYYSIEDRFSVGDDE